MIELATVELANRVGVSDDHAAGAMTVGLREQSRPAAVRTQAGRLQTIGQVTDDVHDDVQARAEDSLPGYEHEQDRGDDE